MNLSKRWPDLVLPVGIIACLMVIFVPLPPALMDVLLAANISVAVIILLATIYLRTPLEFSIFPSILLVTTLARLALNVGTTRLILTRGAIDHEMAAGGVIQSFSQFVTGGSLAVGIAIFAIIFVIQFVVITKGATRISEVAARFALDGLPGRQMAIDAELNAGTIDAQQAKSMRAEVSAHADFYGAMDGASKFVRGDAIAGIIITGINIVAGFAIGLSQSMSIVDATSTFTLLTIGDGLASQLPALLISLAAGLLVTRSAQRTDLPRESLNQVFANPMVLVITAVFLGMLILTDLPKLPLGLIATSCLAGAYLLRRKQRQAENEGAREHQESIPQQPPTPVTIDTLLRHDVLELELGVGLIQLADSSQGGNLLPLITQVRRDVASEMGIIIPKIRVRDNLDLPPQHFRVLLQGDCVTEGNVFTECLLAIDAGGAVQPLADGVVKGLLDDCLATGPAFWIASSGQASALDAGYEVVTATDAMASQLKRITLEYASHLLTRDATRQLIEEVQKTSPAVVDELIPQHLSLAQVQQVLKGLLDEGVSIRPLELILESLGDHAGQYDNRWDLTEQVRIRMGRHITAKLGHSRTTPIRVFTIAADLEETIGEAWERSRDEIRLSLPPETVEALARAIENASKQMVASGHRPVALVSQSIRPVIAELSFGQSENMFVLGNRESSGANIEVVGEVTSEQVVSAVKAA